MMVVNVSGNHIPGLAESGSGTGPTAQMLARSLHSELVLQLLALQGHEAA